VTITVENTARRKGCPYAQYSPNLSPHLLCVEGNLKSQHQVYRPQMAISPTLESTLVDLLYRLEPAA